MSHSSMDRLAGVVERVTFHSAETGWSVVRVVPFSDPHALVTVVVHQAQIFAGSSMEFWGAWTTHPKYGEQFRAERALERKPASSAAMEKYLGSGLIKGVGPITAAKIVKHFKERTMDVFENQMDELLNVPGIAEKKLKDIRTSWSEHKAIRDVMIFLQTYGISTLFAVKIYKHYGNRAIQVVSENPYQLAKDIYGIGFFSADRIALALGFKVDGGARIDAGIRHVLAAAREQGHCYLQAGQVEAAGLELLQLKDGDLIRSRLDALLANREIRSRSLRDLQGQSFTAYYSRSLYYDEQAVAECVQKKLVLHVVTDLNRVQAWVDRHCEKEEIRLSDEQKLAVVGVAGKSFSILTGGPGCGKTTTTKVLVKVLAAMGRKVLLAAPTGRAAQRMTEVIGVESRTLHRLLEWAPGANGFKRGEDFPLEVDFLIVDETSMLDISLAAALLKAVPVHAQVLFIGDPDQLPSVGAGHVLFDLLQTSSVPQFHLTKIFRQSEESLIIRYAHEINRGQVPQVDTPIRDPRLWEVGGGCLFIDAEEATQEQMRFLQRTRIAVRQVEETGQERLVQVGDTVRGILRRSADGELEEAPSLETSDAGVADDVAEPEELVLGGSREDLKLPLFVIPEKFRHVDLVALHKTQDEIDALKAILRSVHPHSALHYGMTAVDVIMRLYSKTLPQYFGANSEVQVLTPQVRGTLGTQNLNLVLQKLMNPERNGVNHIQIGEKIYREGDRVIQTRNNYDLGVFNGDIGYIRSIDPDDSSCCIEFSSGRAIASVHYGREDLMEVALAYSITIHKSQGSEFDIVILPVAAQHFRMLFRNLIYTGLTRAKRLCVLVGSRKAFAMAVRQVDNRRRQTALSELCSLTSLVE